MRKTFILSAILVSSFIGKAQTTSEPLPSKKTIMDVSYRQGTWLLGAGITLVGMTAKCGIFATNHLWIGVEAEKHNFLSKRREAGLFTRYYVGKGNLRGFVGTGLSYGRFESFYMWGDEPSADPKEVYHDVKMNALAGVEVQLYRRLTVEGVAKIGRLTQTNWYQPSFQCSFNVPLGK